MSTDEARDKAWRRSVEDTAFSTTPELTAKVRDYHDRGFDLGHAAALADVESLPVVTAAYTRGRDAGRREALAGLTVERIAQVMCEQVSGDDWTDVPEVMQNIWRDAADTLIEVSESALSGLTVERIAEALYRVDGVGDPLTDWNHDTERLRETYRETVRAVLAALIEQEETKA